MLLHAGGLGRLTRQLPTGDSREVVGIGFQRAGFQLQAVNFQGQLFDSRRLIGELAYRPRTFMMRRGASNVRLMATSAKFGRSGASPASRDAA